MEKYRFFRNHGGIFLQILWGLGVMLRHLFFHIFGKKQGGEISGICDFAECALYFYTVYRVREKETGKEYLCRVYDERHMEKAKSITSAERKKIFWSGFFAAEDAWEKPDMPIREPLLKEGHPMEFYVINGWPYAERSTLDVLVKKTVVILSLCTLVAAIIWGGIMGYFYLVSWIID